jgi:alanyl-tRNA synthetase
MKEVDTRIVKFMGLMPTEKLYHHDLMQTECDAKIIKRMDELVALDKTIFYAESGGQVADHGFINQYPVTHVKKVGGLPFTLPDGNSINVGTAFIHTLDIPEGEECTLQEGDTVHCRLDWERRFHNMQMHTLAHLLFIAVGEVLESLGQTRSTLGCLIDNDKARFDFHNDISADSIPEIERRVQARLDKGGVATVTTIEGVDDAYVWKLDDIEIPCGGTHVNDLSQIQGSIQVKRKNKGSGKIRVSIELVRP